MTSFLTLNPPLSSDILYLPGDPGFDVALLTPRPDTWTVAAQDGDTFAFIARTGDGGMLTPVTGKQLDAYLDSGEYQERLIEMGEELPDYGLG